ncbi:hypothetical protein METBIDRAFT_9697 [Metschnikowia bicuspidata var. bicuspidata NRRL YB-4993]|uniref:Hap4 transcription factor heteromerisation domain-containing protein n=1 Tax=Metschnikowia bicuspidata var. bicuspidata NRRL YB-4993 TaxID=869754 RepID=A0A1A0HHV8_9ASCO|nr:hypothetical protein METBIDRAFT_9697 [Metschnikowia bicuspidata var. bicuspidata NRRL YB-4993]OBA23428.1 hypothetical protein METBIDRAFT_9697 [Metschnikowia bicuspidata var. bicuspidata NRRL YB-4993]
MSCPLDSQPILTITTSKNWVLPPRPKNVRKSKPSLEKKKVKQQTARAQNAPLCPGKVAEVKKERLQIAHPCPAPLIPNSASSSALDSPDELAARIQIINNENYQLKTKLLLLIHDYKSLKSLVTSPAIPETPPVEILYDTTTTARKRVYPEICDDMNGLISDMSGLSHASPHSVVSPIDQELDQSGFEMELFNFINLEQDPLENIGEEYEAELRDQDEDDEEDSAALSRLLSPTSDSDENLLMTTLTRSTTVSTTNSVMEKKPFSQNFKFHDLPEFSEEDYAFLFDKSFSPEKMMSVIEEDQYNQVADFLEEKLMSNDVQYYVEKNHNS